MAGPAVRRAAVSVSVAVPESATLEADRGRIIARPAVCELEVSGLKVPSPINAVPALTSGKPPKASMNWRSIARLFGVLYRRYSSKIEVRDHDWIRRRQPMTQPVRCCSEGAGSERLTLGDSGETNGSAPCPCCSGSTSDDCACRGSWSTPRQPCHPELYREGTSTGLSICRWCRQKLTRDKRLLVARNTKLEEPAKVARGCQRRNRR